eukprot:2275689-Rhodomonas_salina.3
MPIPALSTAYRQKHTRLGRADARLGRADARFTCGHAEESAHVACRCVQTLPTLRERERERARERVRKPAPPKMDAPPP